MEKIIRYVEPQVKYCQKDITHDLAPYLLNLTYTDYAHGKADDLELRLADPERLWINSWYPTKGDQIEAQLTLHMSDIQKTLRCGSFEIDEIEISGFPLEVTIRAHSALVTKDLRLTKKTRAWENTSLREIAQEIASGAGLTLLFDGEDHQFTRIDQVDEPDLAFLKRLCEKTGHYLKVAHEKLIISEKTFSEGGPLAGEIELEDILSLSFSDKTHRIYKNCKVSYWDAQKKKLLTYEEQDPNAPETGETLIVNERVESLSDAIKLAKKRLKMANRFKIEGEVKIPGSVEFVAGVSVMLKNFGILSGKYAVEESRHEYSRSGYITTLKLRRLV